MTILELIHSSSLIHDDIVDRGLLRRHRPTPLKLLGPIEALWCGDYLMGRITERLWTGDCPAELGVRLADVVRQMCLGELEQRSFAWAPRKQNFDTYLHQIDRKTANLMSACCFCGGMVCGLDEKELKQLSDFGLFLGRAFQISDDILDYVPAKDNDKARGQDLKNGIITLPMLYALYEDGSEEIYTLLSRHEKSEEDISRLLEFVMSGCGIPKAKESLGKYCAASLEIIKNIPNTGILSFIANSLSETLLNRLGMEIPNFQS